MKTAIVLQQLPAVFLLVISHHYVWQGGHGLHLLCMQLFFLLSFCKALSLMLSDDVTLRSLSSLSTTVMWVSLTFFFFLNIHPLPPVGIVIIVAHGIFTIMWPITSTT